LNTAIGDLRTGIRHHAPESVFYPAVVDDLQVLKSASVDDITSTSWTRYEADIALLNYLFRLRASSPTVLSLNVPHVAEAAP
jgi:hypothetical protein